MCGAILFRDMGIHGLDNWIMGVNDPNAPFNQIDWVEEYGDVLDQCDWITEEMLENENTYRNLGNTFEKVIRENQTLGYFSSRMLFYKWLRDNSDLLASKIKQEYGGDSQSQTI